MIDGKLGHLEKMGDIWFSERLKYAKTLLKASFLIGLISLLATFAAVATSNTTGWNAVGQVSTAVFAFAVTAYIVSAIAFAFATGPALILGGAAAGLIAILTSAFSKQQF
jgi:hypothetical protein